jgi:hypothetical protein
VGRPSLAHTTACTTIPWLERLFFSMSSPSKRRTISLDEVAEMVLARRDNYLVIGEQAFLLAPPAQPAHRPIASTDP